jgi:hypothetical protein
MEVELMFIIFLFLLKIKYQTKFHGLLAIKYKIGPFLSLFLSYNVI